MAIPWRVEELDIAGYANVLDETMLPSIVPPIFCLRSERKRFFLPPYSFNAGYLCNATEAPEFEIQALRNDGEITVFPEVLRAKAGFELFVDEAFQLHYEPREEASARLAAIADKNISEAESALRLGEFDKADRLASVAISADDRRLTALVIKAAVRRARKDAAGERLMATLALPAVTDTLFRRMVDQYVGPSPAPVKQSAKPFRPMQQVATLQSAAA